MHLEWLGSCMDPLDEYSCLHNNERETSGYIAREISAVGVCTNLLAVAEFVASKAQQ